ncbi:hypothetical protein B0H14DRAFT_2750001 [Mycena olivaceomarginata]|nr:hypothetical protein B0H14DRAFT_2750001 [Mycena olivaceomarginata]
MSGHPPHALCAASYDAAVVCASAYCSEWATAVRYLARTTQRLDNGCAHIVSPSPSPSLQPTDPPPPPRCLSQRRGVASEKDACAASRAAPVPYRAPRSGYCIAPTLRQLARECRKRAAPHGAGALPRRNCACTSRRPSDGCDTLRTRPTCRLDTRGADIRARLAVSRAQLTDAHPSRRYPRWAQSSTVVSAGLHDLPTQYPWATLGLTTSPTPVASHPTSRS